MTAAPIIRLPPAELRTRLAARFPDAVLLPDRAAPPLVTGFSQFDQLLPNGGLPRGRLVVWQSVQSGATAILGSVALNVLAQGERVAWIDGQRALSSQWIDGPLVIRPGSPELAIRAAEILLRSGGFALVVLASVDPDSTDILRLSRMAHEGGGGFVAVTRRTFTASLRLQSHYLPAEYECAHDPFGGRARIDRIALRVEARAPGWQARGIFRIPLLSVDCRCALDPGLADRRGHLGR